MFSYVDFGFMLDFIVFIMRSVFSGVRGIRDVRADINSPLFCLTDREREIVYQHPGPTTHITLLAGPLIQLTSFADTQTKHLILSDTTTGSLAVVTVEL